MSQERLSLASGMDRTFVSMLERGVRQPALSSIFALAEALGVSPAVLVAWAEALLKMSARKRSGR